jgi:hypothetical protein
VVLPNIVLLLAQQQTVHSQARDCCFLSNWQLIAFSFADDDSELCGNGMQSSLTFTAVRDAVYAIIIRNYLCRTGSCLAGQSVCSGYYNVDGDLVPQYSDVNPDTITLTQTPI